MRSATDLALKAFETRPSRAESLADLARHYRELGMNETAQMFARRGMEIPPSDDMLFVETGAQEECRSTFAICAFYAKDLETKALGAQICDELALDRSVSLQTRETARQNLFWYAKSAGELMPSFAAERIDFDAPDGYLAMNPSICRHGDRVVMVMRCVNYRIDESGHYIMPEGETAIRTRNFVCDPRSDCAVEIAGPGEPLYDQVLGFEDIRIIPANDGNLFGVATIRQNNSEGYAEQVRITITPDGESCVWDIMRPEGPRLHEKNWMPVVGGGRHAFIYRCDPTRIVDWVGLTVSESEPEIAADSFSGGSQAIPFDDGWLALIHEAIASPIDGKRCYQHRFVWFNAGLQLKKASRRFYLQANNQIEFAAGLCWHPDERRLLISYGIKDCEAWLGSVDADEVRVLLGLPHQSKPKPRFARFDDDAWVKGQTNRALQDRVAIDRARNMLAQFDLPRHPDHPKSWDSYLALWHAFATTPPGGVVLDAGGTRESVFLRGLARLGFRRLINLNLDEPAPQTEGHVSYTRGDITATGLPDGTFNFISCLSVLEHGVDWKSFLDEAARILVPGGYLFVSVDYWEAPIDTGNRTAFDAPVKIFAPAEIYNFVSYANRLGLDVIGDFDLRCRDRVVNWIGLDFTFFNLLFRKD
jgi:SAM-dependent methyltransferase